MKKRDIEGRGTIVKTGRRVRTVLVAFFLFLVFLAQFSLSFVFQVLFLFGKGNGYADSKPNQTIDRVRHALRPWCSDFVDGLDPLGH